MISIDRLREQLSYDPETGAFEWRVLSRSRRARVGRIAKDSGYHLISIDYKEYRAHRLAFAIMTGRWPADEIDHINGVRNDNRWCNLREATRAQNQQNRRRPSNHGVSRVQGVHKRAEGRYIAQLSKNGKTQYLGTYATPEQAHAAYLEAKRKLHEFNTL